MSLIDNVLSRVKALLTGPASNLPAPGLYHHTHQENGERSRVHLRIDVGSNPQEISGVLLVNANRVLQLNSTAAFMAFHTLEGASEGEIIRLLTHQYQVSTSQALGDYAQFINIFNQAIRPEGACPICDLNLDVTLPFSARPSAPYRMDLAVTYRCNDDCAHCYNARQRNYPELDTQHWFQILDRLWETGIPHVVFTGGEPTLRLDLPELIAHAERNGQITGLNTNGRRLSDAGFVYELVKAGLDHVQITVESHDPAIHDGMVRAKGAWKQTIAGLRHALDTPLYVMTNTTMLRQNERHMGDTLDFLASEGVPTVGLNALIYSGNGLTVGTGLSESELAPLLDLARQRTRAHHQRLIWYTPTQYCNFDPMQLELGVKGCTAALYNMCVEPDGGVIPCQSYYHQLGNILEDPWASIWNHDLSVGLRERSYVPEKCHSCALLPECGGGCPLALNRR